MSEIWLSKHRNNGRGPLMNYLKKVDWIAVGVAIATVALLNRHAKTKAMLNGG